MAAKRMSEGRPRTTLTPAKRQEMAVALIGCGMTYQQIADTLGYRSRSGAKYAYFTALARATLAEREAA